jgi:hypothetical protein
MSSEESELRQRRGAAASSSSSAASEERTESPEDVRRHFTEVLTKALEQKVVQEGRASTREEIDRCVAEDLEKLMQAKKPLPGIKDETKKAKDALAADPYDLEKIWALGVEYEKEEKYVEATNVMLRGWKRVLVETDDTKLRYEYLSILCDCSMKCEMYRQADAIMRDIQDKAMPEEEDVLRAFYMQDCKIQSEISKMTKVIEAFKRALDFCETFDEKAQVWTNCCLPLRKVGAEAVGKQIIDREATTDDQKKKLDTIDKLLALKESIASVKPNGTANYLLVAAAVVLLCVFVWILWWLEQRSLKNLKLKPP